MPVSLHVDIHGLDALAERLEGMPRALKVHQKDAMTKAITLLVADAKAHVHTKRGNAQAGIKPRIDAAGDYGRVNSTTRAARYSQSGRVAGKAPKASYIARKFGVPIEEAFAIARAIGRRGTKPAFPIMRDVYNRDRKRVEELFKDALKNTARSVK